MISKKTSIALISATFLLSLSGCSSKLRPLSGNMVSAEPQPLEVVGNKVPVKVHVTFPAKYFSKDARLKIVPQMRYASGEKWGPSFTFQGEKVMGNEIVVPYEQGANRNLDFAIDYDPAMLRSELFLTFEAYNGSSKVVLPSLKVADGVIATADLASVKDAAPAIAPDRFQRIIKQAFDANIMFLIQQAQVRAKEVNKEDVEEWRYIVQNAKETPNQRVSVEVQAYASPDGGKDLNEKLSEARERNTTKVIKNQFKKQDLADVEINAHYTAQDWEGFKKLVESSNLQDKDLVLRVLEMYPDPEQREKEIKNISAVFSQLADIILPQLRRSRLVANVEIIGKSDDEIKEWAEKYPGRLSLDELLYAATLQQTNKEKERLYKIARQLYPLEYRSYNNLGVLSYLEGNMVQAEYWFTEANKRKMNPETNLNLGLIALQKGDVKRANELISTSSNVPEVGQAMGIIYLNEGQYDKAEVALGDFKNNNAAVAQIMNKDYAKAAATLNAIAQPNAKTSYLKAVVAARTNDAAGVYANLKDAATKDASLVKRMANDLEFAAYKNTPEFGSLLR
ncbi:hypothetical protein [Porphyromonas pogonae]|uniref:tetratricopeptide repeat protein n=1 Tax=Porphyromonas pogonae TaxID=867595 RepID=UPI002E75C1AE|nr:hypothetical protein [Porphyromonas pogonae]